MTCVVCVCQIPVQGGRALKDALAKAMKWRELIPDHCVVYRFNTQ